MDNEQVFTEPEISEGEDRGKNIKKEIIDWVVSIVVAVVIALTIRTFIFTMVKVDGESMHPTLAHGDTLFTQIIGYSPKQGDIVIFHPSISATDRSPNKKTAYVKRVIALEGQTVDITADGDVVVDGKTLKEGYIADKIRSFVPGGTEFPFIVPEDTIFVLGDNRNRSHDSRSADVGAVPLKNIIGKAQIRVFPFNTMGSLYK